VRWLRVCIGVSFRISVLCDLPNIIDRKDKRSSAADPNHLPPADYAQHASPAWIGGHGIDP
jgi:hypothetical protein